LNIELNSLSREIILVLLMCKDYKELDFKELKKLYLGSSKIFWKYVFTLFPIIKITEDRFSRLSKLSSTIYDKIINDSLIIPPKDKNYYEYVIRHIKNRYENEGELYDLKDFMNYLNYNKIPNIKYDGKDYTKHDVLNKRKVYVNILLYSGEYLSDISEYDLNLYANDIYKVVLGKDNDKTIFTKTSEYSFLTKDKEPLPNIKIRPVLKCSNRIDIYRKEDLLGLLKEDCVSTSKDLYIHCNLDLDINIKCSNIFSEYNLIIGDLDAINVRVKDITAGKIRVTNLEAEDINARSIEAINSVQAKNIIYYSVCYAYNKLEYTSIKGTRNNSKHFVLN